MKVKIKRLTETAKLPLYAHAGDVGADLYSDEDFYLTPGSRTIVSTGIALELPESFPVYARIASKSGLALEGYDVAAGVVDRGYRGEIKVVLVNNGKNFRHFRRGDKIAQLIFEVAEVARFEEVELAPSERGANGFGSTGK